MRLWTLLAAVLLTAGAGPSRYPSYALVEPLRSMNNAPPAVWSNYAPAPMPDPDIEGPVRRHALPSHSELTPRLYLPHPSYQGDGFTPNSTVQGEQQRRYRPLPAFNLSVPLQ